MKETHLYFAACEKDGGIEHYLMRNGRIIFQEKTACESPMYLDIEDDILHVLLRCPESLRPNSALQDFPILADGKTGPGGPLRDTGGVVACHLCHWQGRVYAANYLSGSVYSSGGKTDIHEGRGPDPRRQEAPHPHFIAPSPDGKYLLSCDLGLDTVFVYDAELNRTGTAGVPAGHGARHLAYSEDGNAVFCVNEMASTVTVFRYAEGRLKAAETVPSLAVPNSRNTSAAIRVKEDYVYVSQRGEDAVSVLRWDGTALRLQGVYPCGGRSPRDILIVDDYMFCTNELSNSVSVLRLRNHEPEDTGERLEMPHPLCAVMLRKE